MAAQVHPTAPLAPMHYNNEKMAGATVGPLPAPATYSKPEHRRRRRGGLGGCCCCLISTVCSLLLTLIVLAGITVLVLWLVLKPIHLPKYSLDNVEVRSFSVAGSNTLNADFVYNITANNPNRKIGIKYDTIKLDTSYDDQVFGRSTIPGFYQGHRNITSLSSQQQVKSFTLAAGSASTLASEIQRNSVPLHVRADAKVHVRIGKYTSPGFWVRVDCNVVMGVSPATLISKSCKLKRRS